jgi:diguanylate cyclase (GGDEF)-like protein
MTNTRRHTVTVLVMGGTPFRQRIAAEMGASRYTRFDIIEVSSAKAAFEVLCARPCDVLLADAGHDPASEPGLLSPASRMCVVLVVRDVASAAALRCLEAGVQDVLPAAELSAATLERVLCSALIRFQLGSVERHLRRGQALDPLTGVYTAQTLGWHLQSAIEFARRFGDRPALVLLTINPLDLAAKPMGRFRTGLIVQEIARRMRWCVRQNDFIARVGSLRFAVFLRHVTEEATVNAVVQRLVAVGKAPILVQDELVAIRLRAGAAFCTGDDDSLRGLLERAERSIALQARRPREIAAASIPAAIGPPLHRQSDTPVGSLGF